MRAGAVEHELERAWQIGLPEGQAVAQPVPQMQGPYVHSLEFVVEGSYLDVLRYLEKVEALPWRFYWQVLELKTAEYPINRVRVRLNTLSMDKEWLRRTDLVVGLDLKDWEKQLTELNRTTRTLERLPPAHCDYVEIGFGEIGLIPCNSIL